MKKIKQQFQKFLKLPKKTQVFFLALFILIIVPLMMTLGRFIYQGIKEYYLASQNFYFNSDKLKENLAHYQIDNWSGVDPFVITINMNSSKNNKVFSDADISYDISYRCSSNVSCQSTKQQGVIYSSSNTDYFIMTLTPTKTLNEGDTVWLEVITTSTEPYHKTLQGYFAIQIGIPGLSYEIVDRPNQPYFDFNLTNTLDFYQIQEAFGTYAKGDKIDINTYLALSDVDKKKCASAIITLTFNPKEVRLDMTSSAYLRALTEKTEVVDGYPYLNQFSFKVDAISSERVRFYKLDALKDYTYPYGTTLPVVDFAVSS